MGMCVVGAILRAQLLIVSPQLQQSGAYYLVIVVWLKWVEYLAVAGLNLLAQISDRISPFGV